MGGNKGNSVADVMADTIQLLIGQGGVKTLDTDIRVFLHQLEPLLFPVLLKHRCAVQINTRAGVIHL